MSNAVFIYLYIYFNWNIYYISVRIYIYILMFCSWGKAVKGQRFSNLKALTHPKLRQLNKHVGCTLCALQFDLNCRPPLLHQRQGLSYIYIHMGKTLVVLHSFVERWDYCGRSAGSCSSSVYIYNFLSIYWFLFYLYMHLLMLRDNILFFDIIFKKIRTIFSLHFLYYI